MNRPRLVFLAVAILAFSSLMFGQASGSFSYATTYGGGPNQFTTACVLNNDNTGQIVGGAQCPGANGGGNSCTITSDCTTSNANATCFNPHACVTDDQCALVGGVCDGAAGVCTGAGTCVLSSTGGACDPNTACPAGETCVGAIPCETNAQCPANSTCIGGSVGPPPVIGSCSLTGECGITCSGDACGVGEGCIGGLTTYIKTSSGNGNVFVIRPSAVVGLLTDVTVSSTQQKNNNNAVSSSALAGVDFTVTITGPNGKAAPVLVPNGTITYDSRFVQISTNLFNAISTCTALAPCFLTFNESTVSAHSFDWIASNLVSGTYTVTAQWTSSLGDFGQASSMTCVGPVNLTVQQNKVYAPSLKTPSSVSF